MAKADQRETLMLDEASGKALLGNHGIVVPKGVTAPTLKNWQMVRKVWFDRWSSKGLGFAHKSEMGAVRLHIDDLREEEPMPEVKGLSCRRNDQDV